MLSSVIVLTFQTSLVLRVLLRLSLLIGSDETIKGDQLCNKTVSDFTMVLVSKLLSF